MIASRSLMVRESEARVPLGAVVRVRIGNYTIEGKVYGAENNAIGGVPNWYIQMYTESGPWYWKQGEDGGHLVEVDNHPLYVSL